MNNQLKCPKCGEYFEPSEAFKHQFEEQITDKVKKDVLRKAQETLTKELKDRDAQISELKKRAEKAEEEELKIRKEKRELEEAKAKFELNKQRQLDSEREKIRLKAVEEIQEKDKFKFAEYEKKMADMKKALDEATKKAAQGSQQLQGEVLELDLEVESVEEFRRIMMDLTSKFSSMIKDYSALTIYNVHKYNLLP